MIKGSSSENRWVHEKEASLIKDYLTSWHQPGFTKGIDSAQNL